VNEYDPRRDDDPLWFDRVEAEEPAGPVLTALAFLSAAVAALPSGRQLYWLPDTLWCRVATWIKDRRSSSIKGV
jgi:hypothetical protein